MVQASKVPAAVSANPDWQRAIAQADGWIHELLGKWAESKSWEWDVKPDADGQPRYDFRMEYEGVAAAERFDRFEVANRRLVTDRVSAVWGQLLDQAVTAQWGRVKQMIRQLELEEPVAN